MPRNYRVFGGPRSLFTRKLTAALDFYDVLNNSEVAVVDAWPVKTNLTELFTS